MRDQEEQGRPEQAVEYLALSAAASTSPRLHDSAGHRCAALAVAALDVAACAPARRQRAEHLAPLQPLLASHGVASQQPSSEHCRASVLRCRPLGGRHTLEIRHIWCLHGGVIVIGCWLARWADARHAMVRKKRTAPGFADNARVCASRPVTDKNRRKSTTLRLYSKEAGAG